MYMLIQATRYAIQIGGDVDFLVTRRDDPGWLKDVAITVLVAPPWWVVVLSLVIGAGLLFWAHRSPLPSANRTGTPQDDPIAQNALEDEVFALRAENKQLRSWKAKTSGWEDKIERLERVKLEHDGCTKRFEALNATIADLKRDLPKIDRLELDPREGLYKFTMSGQPPQTYAIRRINLVNSGRDTNLRKWRVRLVLPGGGVVQSVTVLPSGSWEVMREAAVDYRAVQTACSDSAIKAVRNEEMKLDVPFVVDGLNPDDIPVFGTIAEVFFTDDTGREWSYGPGPMQRRV